MNRTISRESLNLSLSYERSVERTSDDDSDPHPSFPPMRVVETDGETVDECTVPYEPVMVPLRKCAAVIPFARTLRRVS